MTDDWRLTNQGGYLTGVELAHRAWVQQREGWDHDHCEFCFAKFGIDGDLSAGYCTTELPERWICDDCFTDFVKRFNWRIAPSPGD